MSALPSPAAPTAPSPADGRVLREIAIVGLERHAASSGIGRVLHGLLPIWRERVAVGEARVRSLPVPLLRNVPSGLDAPAGAQVVVAPQLTGAEVLRSARAPGLAIVHDVGIVDLPEERAARDRLGRWLVDRSLRGLRHAGAIAAVSRFSRDRLVAHLPELDGRVHAIPNGVDDAFLADAGPRAEARAAARARLEPLLGVPLRDPDAPLVVYVGSEIGRKNVPVLIGAVAIARRSRPGLRLLKVGRPGGPEARERTLAAARAAGLEPGRDLLLLEGCDDDVLTDAYRAADAFASASLYEGFGLPALEAMALGTPVAVSDRGALPEVVGDAGSVAAPSAEAMAGAILRALDAPARRVEAARARARGFSWRASAERYLEVMEGIARG